MSRKLSFLHTADLHIGAPMRGFRDLSSSWAARLRRAICESFDRVIDAAIERAVDFVVIAGDSFDTSGASYGDYLHFFEGLSKLDAAGIAVYLVPGNHDPYTVWQKDIGRLPASARMMGWEGPEFDVFVRDGEPLCLIGARGYRSQAWPVDEPISAGITRNAAVMELRAVCPDASSAPFAIGIIHTGLDIDQSKAYSAPHVLMGADIDYWACGHLHKQLVQPSRANPRIAFPGSIQGRDLKEAGPRGCFIVTMEESSDGGRPSVTLENVATASVVFATVAIDVSACQTLTDVNRLVQTALFRKSAEAGCDEVVSRIVLKGATDLHAYLVQPTVLADIRKRINEAYPTFFCDALVNRTEPLRDKEAIAREGLFGAHVLSASEGERTHVAETVNYLQSEFVKRGIDVPSSLTRQLAGFVAEAETLVLDLIESEQR